MHGVPVQYAIPRRQVWVVVGAVFALVGGIVALGLTVKSPPLVTGLALASLGSLLWWLKRNVNGEGVATCSDTELKIDPQRPCYCAGKGTIRIAWDSVETVQAGSTAAPKQARPYLILRLRQPRRSWIVMPRDAEQADFLTRIVVHVEAAKARAGHAALEVRSPFDSRGWRVGAVVALLAFGAGVIGTIVAGKANDLFVWGRVCVLGAFALSLASQVFGSRRR